MFQNFLIKLPLAIRIHVQIGNIFSNLGATRNSMSGRDMENINQNINSSPARTTRISPRRAQGRTSPMTIVHPENEYMKRSSKKNNTNDVSEDESHNETKVSSTPS